MMSLAEELLTKKGLNLKDLQVCAVAAAAAFLDLKAMHIYSGLSNRAWWLASPAHTRYGDCHRTVGLYISIAMC